MKAMTLLASQFFYLKSLWKL